MQTSVRRYNTIALGLLKKKNKKKEEFQIAIFHFVQCIRKLRYYSDVILIRLEISCRTRWWCLKCVIVYLSQDISLFIMYCVSGESGSSLLIESTDSVIHSSWTTNVPYTR